MLPSSAASALFISSSGWASIDSECRTSLHHRLPHSSLNQCYRVVSATDGNTIAKFILFEIPDLILSMCLFQSDFQRLSWFSSNEVVYSNKLPPIQGMYCSAYHFMEGLDVALQPRRRNWTDFSEMQLLPCSSVAHVILRRVFSKISVSFFFCSVCVLIFFFFFFDWIFLILSSQK